MCADCQSSSSGARAEWAACIQLLLQFHMISHRNMRVVPAPCASVVADLCPRQHRLTMFCWYVRRYSSCKAFCIGFAATFFAVFDVPVFWPILLLYWFVLFFLTMKRQIRHMIKYRYVPFSVGEPVNLSCSPTCADYVCAGLCWQGVFQMSVADYAASDCFWGCVLQGRRHTQAVKAV